MATTPSELPPPAVAPPLVGRLHPLSWLFVLLVQLKPFALPLAALLFLGRGEVWELWGAAGAAGLALYAVVYSFGFRYELGANELVVREGIFARTERHVPYARIQNVVQRRNVLHRMFGVSELVLESAGSGKPEARMNVITVAEAARIERVLRGHGAGGEAASDAAAAPPLLALDAGEIVRLGLVTNRGAVVIGAAFALLWQFEPWESGALRGFFRGMRGTVSAWSDAFAGPVALVASGVAFVALFFVTLKLLSIAASFVRFHGFTLSVGDGRIATVGGLLTRHGANARFDKIQRLVYRESWLARALGRRSLECDVAAGRAASADGSESVRLKWLAPIATPARIEAIVAELAPGLGLEGLEWQPLHPRAWRRMFRPALAFWTVAAIAPTWWLGPGVVVAWLALVVLAWLDARGNARFAGYALHGDVLAYRAGWLTRHWAVARIPKGQVVRLSRSAFDRRAGMGSVALDTAGASSVGFQLRVPYLGEAEARALAARIRAAM